MKYQVESMRLENIGGFTVTEFGFKKSALLIGENNAGKTSILRILNWVFNELDGLLLEGHRVLTEDETALLQPARPTRSKARRIFLRVRIDHSRSAARYGAINGLSELRIQFRKNAVYATLEKPTRGEPTVSTAKAMELLIRTQDEYRVLYVPTGRDATSTAFVGTMRSLLKPIYEKQLIPEGRGSVTRELTTFRQSMKNISSTTERHAEAFWSHLSDNLYGGIIPSAKFEVDVSVSEMISWLVERTSLKFSMGDHDADRVELRSLGAGFQSLMWIALYVVQLDEARHRVLLLEEPEAFLHPSAQRLLARQLFLDENVTTVVTTHSPIVLAESPPDEVVVMRQHVAYEAAPVSDIQDAKDRFLLSSEANNALFDQSLLLVEGPGDVAYYEAMRRKLDGILPADALSRMRVVSVGGKERFAPWIRLLHRFTPKHSNEIPWSFLISTDSADAISATKRALRDGGVSVPVEVLTQMSGLPQSKESIRLTADEVSEIHDATRKINDLSQYRGAPIHLAPVDLEYVIFENLEHEQVKRFAELLDIELAVGTKEDLMGRLGSKGGSKSNSPLKAPYARALLAQEMEWPLVSIDIKDLLWRWAAPALSGRRLARPDCLKAQRE